MDIKQQLAHVRWIGGSPCSGKSTITAILADKLGWTFYECDRHYDEHVKRSEPRLQPAMNRLSGLSWDALWSQPVEQLIAEAILAYREQFGMIVEDLLKLPRDTPILVEGAALLPDCVLPLLTDAQQAIWLVPRPDFQLQHYAAREWIQSILDQCREPEKAFANWMARDIGFAETVAVYAEGRGLKVIWVDDNSSLQANTAAVAAHFGIDLGLL
jgi:uridine kinase